MNENETQLKERASSEAVTCSPPAGLYNAEYDLKRRTLYLTPKLGLAWVVSKEDNTPFYIAARLVDKKPVGKPMKFTLLQNALNEVLEN